MSIQLNPDLSFCELDGRLVFLDIEKDRYFSLSNELERSFRRYRETHNPQDPDIERLVAHRILKREPPTDFANPLAPLEAPEWSAVETSRAQREIPFRVIIGVFRAVVEARRWLGTRTLGEVARALSRNRTHGATSDRTAPGDELLLLAASFNIVRPYVPIQMRCLIDSLALVRFLQKHGHDAQLVIGIACDPFSAHAWVQSGCCVLNDTLGSAESHVPIRVI